MAYTPPSADFVTSALSGAIVAGDTTMTIGTGLNIPATYGILQIDYDSAAAVGAEDGPETISYTAYNTSTGALTGVTRGLAGTTAVAHGDGNSVNCGMSSLYLAQSPQYDTWNAAGTLTYASADSPTFTATVTGDSTSAIYPGVRLKYQQDQPLSYYWTFNASSAADVGANATMGDVSDPAYTAGKFGNGLVLDGNDALTITDHADFKPTGAFTLGMWIKTATTGASQWLFQSYSDNTNANGIRLRISTDNTLYFGVGNNSAAESSSLAGKTNVADNAWHHIAISAKDNFTQIYVDGNLEVSGYTVTPTYAATNYVRIGCGNVAGSDLEFYTGTIDDLFYMKDFALDEQTIKAKYVAGTAQGTGDITVTKYALCTASSYANPTTTITLYGGTDYPMIDDTISNAYYSTQKAPLGFPLNPKKWEVRAEVTSLLGQSTPTQNTWYNFAGSLVVPIGNWDLRQNGRFQVNDASSGTYDVAVCLSKTNNGSTDPELVVGSTHGIIANSAGTVFAVNGKFVSLATKTQYYWNMRTTGAGIDQLYVRGDLGNCAITATSTLL